MQLMHIHHATWHPLHKLTDIDNTEKPKFAFQCKAIQDFHTQQEATSNPQQGIVSEDHKTMLPPKESTSIMIDDTKYAQLDGDEDATGKKQCLHSNKTKSINKSPLVLKHGSNEGDEVNENNLKPGIYHWLKPSFLRITQPRELAYHLVIQPTLMKMVSWQILMSNPLTIICQLMRTSKWMLTISSNHLLSRWSMARLKSIVPVKLAHRFIYP